MAGFFDSRTPESFLAQIQEFETFDRFYPCFLQDHSSDAIRRAVLEHLHGNPSYLITTTLDNDDAIARDFVENIQAVFDGQDFELVNFCHGYRLQTQTGKLYQGRLASNPFITLIEKNAQPLTIIGCLPHSTIQARYPFIFAIESDPSWIQVLHGLNIAVTGVRAWKEFHGRRLLQDFRLTTAGKWMKTHLRS